jgi:hypothetical protein
MVYPSAETWGMTSSVGPMGTGAVVGWMVGVAAAWFTTWAAVRVPKRTKAVHPAAKKTRIFIVGFLSCSSKRAY